jgi:hypothetical protein
MVKLRDWSRALSRGRSQGIRTVAAWLLGGILLGIVSLAAGCATGRIVGGMYRDPEAGFQVRLPRAVWQLQSMDGAALSFASAELQAGMALRVDCHTPESGGLPWVARHLFFGLQDMQIRGRETVRLHDAMAVQTRVRARLDDRPVEVEGVTFRRAGCLYDFIYVAPPAVFPQGRADFEAFVQSWSPLAER